MQGVANGSPVFQFHKGTIKPVAPSAAGWRWLPFQFHKGTIKPGQLLAQSVAHHGFQFHKGTIKPLVGLLGGLLDGVSIP